MMYKNIQDCLRDVYRFGALRIEPQGNTGAVMEWCESKGVGGSKSDLTQVEWHANARMIQNRIERLLSPVEVAAVECEHGEYGNLHYLATVLLARNVCDDLALCGDMLAHIYSCGKNPRRVAIMDKYDLPNMTFVRRRAKINDALAGIANPAMQKLDDDFRKKGIITD